MSLSQAKLPTIVVSSVLCLAVGIGVGAVGMHYLEWAPQPYWEEGGPAPPGAGRAGGPAGGMMGKGMAGKGGGEKAPSAKVQLAALVTKLDLLTQKPLSVNLDAAQKEKVREQLKGLDVLETLSDEQAKQRLDELLTVLKDQRKPLEAVGFLWPGQKGGASGPSLDMTPNPFKLEPTSKHLQSLQTGLVKS